MRTRTGAVPRTASGGKRSTAKAAKASSTASTATDQSLDVMKTCSRVTTPSLNASSSASPTCDGNVWWVAWPRKTSAAVVSAASGTSRDQRVCRPPALLAASFLPCPAG